jgi:translation initiation factor SUI1
MDADTLRDLDRGTSTKKVHLFLDTRKKRVTVMKNLDEDLDEKLICRALRKVLNCQAFLSRDKRMKETIMVVQGDKRFEIEQFLIRQKIYTPERVEVHGGMES